MTKPSKILLGIAVTVVVAALVFTSLILFGGSKWATASIGLEVYTFRLADNPIERARGLSGVEIGDLRADGMLFVFPDEAARTFTMRGMKFPLDILWIRDNKIMHIDYGVSAPIAGRQPELIDSAPILADMVIEVPAGRAQEMNFQIGHTLTLNLDAKAAK